MFRISRSRLGYRKKREYLDERDTSKAGIVVWLQRFIMIVLLIVVMLFLLLLGNVVHAAANDQQLPPINIRDVTEGSLLFKAAQTGIYHQVPTVQTDVDMRVSGMIVRTRIIITCYPLDAIVPGGS